MTISMTRAEYQAKYGVAPVIPSLSKVDTTVAPRRMTQAEYDAEYRPTVKKPGFTEPGGTFDKTMGFINEFNPAYQIPKMAMEGGMKFTKGITDNLDIALGRNKPSNVPVGEQITGNLISSGAGLVQGALAIPFGMFESVTNLPGVKQVKNFLWGTEPNSLSLPNLVAGQSGLNLPGIGDIKPLQDLIQKHQNTPEVAGDLITIILGLSGAKGLKKPKLKAEIQAELQAAYDNAKKYIPPEAPPPGGNKATAKLSTEIAKIEDQYVKLRTSNEYSKDAGAASRVRIAQADVLRGAVDDTGTIRTKQPGGAVEQYTKKTIDGVENVVYKNLERLGETINLKQVKRELTAEVADSGLEGADLIAALNGIKKEIEGLSLRADPLGNIPLALVHKAKINTTKNINYATPPETATYRKAVARSYKKLVEDNSSFNTSEVNAELGKYMQDIKRLENLDGKKVKGGKLSKYTAQIGGNIAGAAIGGMVGGLGGSAAGTIVGGEVASFIRGKSMSNTFGKGTGTELPRNAILEQARREAKLPPQVDLTKPDLKIGVNKSIPKTKEIIKVERQIEKNVEAQKKAIKEGNFSLVAALKEIYANLVAKLRDLVKKVKETPNREGGFVKNPFSREPKSGKLSETKLVQSQQSLTKSNIEFKIRELAKEKYPKTATETDVANMKQNMSDFIEKERANTEDSGKPFNLGVAQEAFFKQASAEIKNPRQPTPEPPPLKAEIKKEFDQLAKDTAETIYNDNPIKNGSIAETLAKLKKGVVDEIDRRWGLAVHERTVKEFDPAKITKEYLEKQVAKTEHIPEKNEVARLLKKEVIGRKIFIDSWGEKLIEGTKAILWTAPNKTLKSAIDKLPEKFWNVSDLNDLARNSIIVDKSGMQEILSRVDELKTYTPERAPLIAEGGYKFFRAKDNAGFEGHKYNIKTPDGGLAETQVLTPEMAYGKAELSQLEKILGKEKIEEIRKLSGVEPGLGHVLYKKMQFFGSGEQRLSPEFQNLIKQSEEYYAKLKAIEK